MFDVVGSHSYSANIFVPVSVGISQGWGTPVLAAMSAGYEFESQVKALTGPSVVPGNSLYGFKTESPANIKTHSFGVADSSGNIANRAPNDIACSPWLSYGDGQYTVGVYFYNSPVLFILMCSLFFQMATLFHAQNKVSIVQVLVMDTDNQFKPNASPLTYSTKSNWPLDGQTFCYRQAEPLQFSSGWRRDPYCSGGGKKCDFSNKSWIHSTRQPCKK